MKLKFFLLSFLLLFARGCDFYSTSLWFFQEGDADGETNPLTSIFGFGWYGLIISNALIMAIIIYAFYRFSFRYRLKMLTKIPNNVWDYASELYFHQRCKLHLLLFRVPVEKKTYYAHLGYVSIRVIIVASFLATFHNCCQYYDIAFYNTFREVVKRPLFVIYGLILLSFVFFTLRFWSNEFQQQKRAES